MGNTNNDIAQRIKQRREELGLSQDELAKKLGYKNRSSIQKIEKNVNKLTQSKIKDIAKALDTTPAWIMGWNDSDTTLEIDYIVATQDAELLTIFHDLSATDKERLVEMAKLFLQKP